MSLRVLPGAAVGVLGSGQLGRMLALAARRMGYRVHTFSPDEDSPTGQVADVEVVASYDDLDAVKRFAKGVSVVTFEFENISSAAANAAADVAPVRPHPSVLHVAQHRLREKQFLQSQSLPVPPFVAVRSLEDLHAGLARLGVPAVLKRAASGYDGKGQAPISHAADAESAWKSVGGVGEMILESFVSFERELSVVATRGHEGSFAAYPPIENAHERHILDVSLAPARVSPAVAAEAQSIARTVMEALDVVGVLCVEMFLTKEGRLLVNELAPRPHNSGHLTIDAAAVSQFEQQLRAVCGLPLGDTELRPAAMANLLGDLWEGGEPDWQAVLARPGVALHLYGKAEARPGRKMGHLTALGATADEARARVLAARDALTAGRAPQVLSPRERVS